MGLFSGKKKIYVSSVVYPLGEDEGPKKRDFLKYTVLNAQMQGQPIADSITQGYLKGQGMALRNCFQYAREKYTEGVPVSSAKYLEDNPEVARTIEGLIREKLLVSNAPAKANAAIDELADAEADA